MHGLYEVDNVEFLQNTCLTCGRWSADSVHDAGSGIESATRRKAQTSRHIPGFQFGQFSGAHAAQNSIIVLVRHWFSFRKSSKKHIAFVHVAEMRAKV